MDKCACGPLTEVTLWVRLKLRNYGGKGGRRRRRLFRKASLPTKVDTDMLCIAQRKTKRWAAQQEVSTRVLVAYLFCKARLHTGIGGCMFIRRKTTAVLGTYRYSLTLVIPPTNVSPHALHETSTPPAADRAGSSTFRMPPPLPPGS